VEAGANGGRCRYIAQHHDRALAALIPPLRLQLSQKNSFAPKGG
jgi:hypothetical protein